MNDILCDADDAMISPPIDGRARRSQKSRQRIIDAMIELVQAGVLEPTADQVAERAGLAMRTVFRHFTDMESLYREIARRMQSHAQPLLDEPIDGATWQATLHKLVDKRARLYEELLPMRRAADALRHRSPFLQQEDARFARLARDVLRRTLPAELAGDPERFEALDALLSYDMWMRLRRSQRLSASAARRVLHAATASLTASPASGP
ncbi:MAG: TetR/AcrR family transcriptional regulator [Gammaproteobacteria bacterium]|nr:TetR/AcrR family transcriptional regulator [Gammaproteobacteria bacterium]